MLDLVTKVLCIRLCHEQECVSQFACSTCWMDERGSMAWDRDRTHHTHVSDKMLHVEHRHINYRQLAQKSSLLSHNKCLCFRNWIAQNTAHMHNIALWHWRWLCDNWWYSKNTWCAHPWFHSRFCNIQNNTYTILCYNILYYTTILYYTYCNIRNYKRKQEKDTKRLAWHWMLQMPRCNHNRCINLPWDYTLIDYYHQCLHPIYDNDYVNHQ